MAIVRASVTQGIIAVLQGTGKGEQRAEEDARRPPAGEAGLGVRPQKNVSPGHKKRVVEAAVKERVCSGRTGCRLLKLTRSSYWCKARRRLSRSQELVKRIHALATEHRTHYSSRIAIGTRNALASFLKSMSVTSRSPRSIRFRT